MAQQTFDLASQASITSNTGQYIRWSFTGGGAQLNTALTAGGANGLATACEIRAVSNDTHIGLDLAGIDLNSSFESEGAYLEIRVGSVICRAVQASPVDSTNPYRLVGFSDSPVTPHNWITTFRTLSNPSAYLVVSDTPIPPAPSPSGGGNRRRRRTMWLSSLTHDSKFVDLELSTPMATTHGAPSDSTPRARSDGMVREDMLELAFNHGAIQLASNAATIGGGYLLGPNETAPDRTVYRISADLVSNVTIELVAGIAPATVSNSASGDALASVRTLSGSSIGDLMVDELVALSPFAGVLAGRPAFFGVRISKSSAATAYLRGTLSVLRRVGAGPTVVDPRIN